MIVHRADGQSPYISVDEAARLLGMDAQAVRYQLRRHRLAGQKFGSLWRVARASVEAQLAPVTTTAPEPPAIERARALLAELTAAERLDLARAALAEAA